MHNAAFTFTTADMKAHLQCMIELLREPGLHVHPHTDTAANDAIDEINQVRLVKYNCSSRFLDMLSGLTKISSYQCYVTD